MITDVHNKVTSADEVASLLRVRPLLVEHRATMRQQAEASAGVAKMKVARDAAANREAVAAAAKAKAAEREAAKAAAAAKVNAADNEKRRRDAKKAHWE